MKRSISFLLGGVLIMTGMYCKKDSSVMQEFTKEDMALQMSRDPDFVQLYQGILHYNDFVGASGQVTKFASLARDEARFSEAARLNLDEMALKFPKEEEVEILNLCSRIIKRYALRNMPSSDAQTVIRTAVDIIDPPGALTSNSDPNSRVELNCWEKLIQQESRCDRDMAIGGVESVVLGTAGVLAGSGVGAPLAVGIMTVGLIVKFVRHSNCINDALKDYKDCSNP